jgi:nitroreductase
MDGNHKLNDHFIEQLNWRYAVKRFDPERKLSEEDVKTLEDALLLSPSSYGLQPWKFLIITDQKLKDELRPHAWNQPQISDCSHLVVMANKKYVGDEDVDVY